MGRFNLKKLNTVEVKEKNAHKVLVGKRPLGKPRRRKMDNIKMDR
jgi:hypothetical protein